MLIKNNPMSLFLLMRLFRLEREAEILDEELVLDETVELIEGTIEINSIEEK